MTNNRIPLVAAALFFFCITLLLIYLLRVRLYSPLPNAVFWFSTYTAILAIVFQITRIPWRGHEGFLVAEILILGIALHLVFQITIYGIYGSDSYRIIAMVEEILEHGRLVGEPAGVYIPLQKIHGAALNYITGISMFNIAKWFSSILSTFFVLVLYVLIKKVFRSEKLALLAILLMVTLQTFAVFGSSYHHANFALIPAMTMLFFLTKAKGSNRIKFSACAILCLFAVILSHHVTPLVILLFLLVHLVFKPFSGSVHGNYLLTSKQAMLRVTVGFTLIAFIGLFFHWMYIYSNPLVLLVKWSQALLFPKLEVETFAQTLLATNPQNIQTLKGHIIFFGFYIFHTIFALILLYRVFSQPRGRYPEFYSFTSFLFIFAILSLVHIFVVAKEVAILGTHRLMMLGWIFGFAPLTACILEKKPRWGEKAGIGLLAAFMLFNIYMTPPGVYDLNFPPGREVGNNVLREDHALAETLVFTGKVAAYHKTKLAINYAQGFLPRDLLTVSSVDQLEELDCIVIKKGELERYIERGHYGFPGYEYSSDVVNRLAELSRESSYYGGRNRIYDSKNLVVVR